MSDKDRSIQEEAAPGQDSPNPAPTDDNSEGSTSKRPIVLTACGLALGALALALATIPVMAFEEPMPNPFEDPDDPADLPEFKREGGIQFKFKDVTVNLGGKDVEVPAEEKPDELEVTSDPIRWFTIAAITTAIIGLVVSSIGQVRERHTGLTIGAMGCCAAAISWQYIAIGIAVGAAAAMFLIVMAMLGGMVNAG